MMKLKRIIIILSFIFCISLGLISCFDKEETTTKKISIDNFTYEIKKNSDAGLSALVYDLSFEIEFSVLEQSSSKTFSFMIQRIKSEMNMTIDYCNTEHTEIYDSGHISFNYELPEDVTSMSAIVNLKITTTELIDDINKFLEISIIKSYSDELVDDKNFIEEEIFKMNYSDGANASSDVIHYKFDEFSESYEVISVITRTKILQIPETYNEYPVRKIAEGAFKIESEIEELVLPNTITTLSKGLLKEMRSLKALTIPFLGASLNDTENDYLGYLFDASSYEQNSSYVPSSLKEIHLTAATSIEDYAFYKCSNITNITLPNGIENIGYRAFFECNQLEYKEYSNGYYLGNEENPFLAFVKVKSTYNYDFNLHMNTKVIAASAFFNYAGLKSIDLPNGLISIGKEAFYECYNLANITIPESVTEIHNGAFRGCEKLTSVIIPNKIKEISYSMFLNCKNLKSITIPEGVTSIGMLAFAGCNSLSEIVLPETLIYIDDNAFENCSSIKNIILPKTILRIEAETFKGCYGLQTISIPNSIEYIDSTAFISCQNLVYNEYDNGYYLGNEENPYLLLKKSKSSDITSCKIHSDTKMIGQQAFSGNSRLQSIAIPNGVRSIGKSAFSDCKNLVSITLPSSVTMIDRYAFNGSNSLVYNEYDNGYYLGSEENPYHLLVKAKSTDIKSCVAHKDTALIYSDAFKDCSKLTSITLSHPVQSIGQDAFKNCCINNVYFDGNIEDWCKIDIHTNIFSTSTSNLNHFYLKNNDNKWEEVVKLDIPNSVTNIGRYQFAYFTNVSFIKLGEETKIIQQEAFKGCSGLEGILIPNTVTEIGIWSFNSCDHLKEVYYMGTYKAWNDIDKQYSNINPIIYFYSKIKPNKQGNYWHYVNDVITKW